MNNMSRAEKDPLVVLAFAVGVLFVTRNSDTAISFLRWAAEDSSTAQKADHGNDDLLGSIHAAQKETNRCHAGEAGNDEAKKPSCDVRTFLVCTLDGVNDGGCYRLKSGPDCFPRSGAGVFGCRRRPRSFCDIVVFVHARFLSRLKLWNSDRKGGRA